MGFGVSACSTTYRAADGSKIPAPTEAKVPAAEVTNKETPKVVEPTPPAVAATVKPEPEKRGIVVTPLSPAQTKSDAQKDLERALSLYGSGEESQALVSFTDFMRRYPENSRVPEAQFYIGEIYFHQRKFNEALEEYGKVVVGRGMKSAKAGDAILRRGECYQKLGENIKAQIEWNAAQRRFPRSSVAERASVLLKGLP
ncbi:MAG: tetratricopeptide repeat protein [Bdellovibrionales bacterium]|nr:tetratricopeptide repeat protein [Bdellovibrionales bacterium]